MNTLNQYFQALKTIQNRDVSRYLVWICKKWKNTFMNQLIVRCFLNSLIEQTRVHSTVINQNFCVVIFVIKNRLQTVDLASLILIVVLIGIWNMIAS